MEVGIEASMFRWTCGYKLKERKRNAEIRELLGLETVSSAIKRGRLRRLRHNVNGVKGTFHVQTIRCTMMETDRTR